MYHTAGIFMKTYEGTNIINVINGQAWMTLSHSVVIASPSDFNAYLLTNNVPDTYSILSTTNTGISLGGVVAGPNLQFYNCTYGQVNTY
jgi:hypothetical protein